MSSLAAVAPVLANAANTEGGGSGSGIFMILLFMLPLAFLFFMMRSQRTRQRKMAEQQRSLDVGDEIMTTTGLYATIVGGDDKIALIEPSPGVQLRWDRRAIMPVEQQPAQPPAEGDDTTSNEN